MLTLTRREGEKLVFRIDDLEFQVVVPEISGSQAKVSIDAPRHVVVLREELINDE